jgi:ParB family chromosome partitioning protein
VQSATLKQIEDSLRQVLATQVRLKMKSDDQGAIEIEFYSLEELERLLEVLTPVESAMGRNA